MTAPEPPAARPPVLGAADEGPHAAGADPWWHECWTFDVWTPGGLGLCTALTVLPGQGRTWYWCALVRPGEPLVHLADLHVPSLRPGLEVRTDGLWASHTCEAPFEQWTVANEAYAVALDDPAAALGRALGVVVPIAADLEWYAASPARSEPTSAPGAAGYGQPGSVDGTIELGTGRVELEDAASWRTHRWGILAPALGEDEGEGEAAVRPDGAWAPFTLDGPTGTEVLDRVLTPSGWWERRRR